MIPAVREAGRVNGSLLDLNRSKWDRRPCVIRKPESRPSLWEMQLVAGKADWIPARAALGRNDGHLRWLSFEEVPM